METIAKVLTALVAFGLFFWISKKLFWTGIQQVIEERQTRISSEFDKISSLQKDVNDLKADYEKRLSQIEQEAAARKQEEINHGRKVADEIIESARKEASAEIERVKQTVAIEMDKARATLKQEVVKMTLEATEKILREKVDAEHDRRLVNQFVEEISAQ